MMLTCKQEEKLVPYAYKGKTLYMTENVDIWNYRCIVTKRILGDLNLYKICTIVIHEALRGNGVENRTWIKKFMRQLEPCSSKTWNITAFLLKNDISSHGRSDPWPANQNPTRFSHLWDTKEKKLPIINYSKWQSKIQTASIEPIRSQSISSYTKRKNS
jgi:hypothetical protein